MTEEQDDFCTECGQKHSRRWVNKLGIMSAVSAVAAALSLKLPGAVQDAAAKDWRPLTHDEWDNQFFADERNGISQLQEPSAAENYPTLHVPTEFWLGEDANLVAPEHRAAVIAFEQARVQAWQSKDRAWYDQHAPILAPATQHIAHAEAHFCGSGTGSYQYSCALQFRQTRTSSTCAGGYSCWGYYSCADGHSSYCRIFCGPCSM